MSPFPVLVAINLSICVGSSPSPPERRAASELMRYLRMMGFAPRIVKGMMRGREATIVLGTLQSNAFLRGFVKGLGLPPDWGARDGFAIVSKEREGRTIVGIVGERGRGVLYGSYALLELMGCGFFWDGERIPGRSSLPPPGTFTVKRPHFKVRQYLQGCAFGYSASHWDFEDWRRELDWAAKRGFNRLLFPTAGTAIQKIVLRKLGVDLGGLTERERWELETTRRLAEYARQMGFELIYPAPLGGVPDAFVKRFPRARYVEPRLLHPLDPLFRKVGEEFVRELTKQYGTDHLYNVDPFAERPMPVNPVDFAREVMGYLRGADPEAVWYASGWAWRFRFGGGRFWSKEMVFAFLDALPENAFYVCDIYGDFDLIYGDFDYFRGKRWGFSVLHSFGGAGHMYGDVRDLIRRVRGVAGDPKARRCEVFYLNPEVLHYNTFYFDLAAHLAWEPFLRLDEFIPAYVRRRYGPEEASRMEEFLRLLCDSVYGPLGGGDPFYHRRMHDFFPNIEEAMTKREVAGKLREALAVALSVRRELVRNPLFVRDVVDVARQALYECFNLLVLSAYSAFERGDKGFLRRVADELRRCFSLLEELHCSFPRYHIAPIKLKVMAQPGGREAWPGVKNVLFTFAAGGPLDYQAKDWFELLKLYYRPRFEAWLRALLESPAGKLPRLDEVYKKVELRWAERDIEDMPPQKGPSPSPFEVVPRIVNFVSRTISHSASWWLTGGREVDDEALLLEFKRSFVQGKPNLSPSKGMEVYDDFDSSEINGRKWERWLGDPCIAPWEISPNFVLDGVAVIRTGMASRKVFRGRSLAVEFLGRFVNPHPDWCSFVIFSPATGEAVKIYHQSGGPFATVFLMWPDGRRKGTLDGLPGGQGWHLYRVEIRPGEVAFFVDGKERVRRSVNLRATEWRIGFASRSWYPYRGATAVCLDFVAVGRP